MSKLSRKEKREAMKKRQAQNANETGSKFGKSYLDLSKFSDVKFFKPKKGKNIIDIIPFEVSTKNHPKQIPIGYEDYVLDIFVHKSIGVKKDNFVCLQETYGKPCPVCEERNRLLTQGKEKEADKLKPKHRAIYNVIDLDAKDEGIKIFDTVYFFFEKEMMDELKSCDFDETPLIADIEEGMSVKFRGASESFEGNEFLKFKSFDFIERDEPYTEDILDEAYPLDKILVIPTYEDVEKSLFGADFEGDDEEDDEGEEKETPKVSKRGVDKPVERQRNKPNKESKCPHGHDFGEDTDAYTKDCDNCAMYDECADEYDSKH